MSRGNIVFEIKEGVVDVDGWRFYDANGLIALVIGCTTAPVDGASGYGDGCTFIHTAASGGGTYMNIGTSTSAVWVEAGAVGSP